MPLVDDPLPKFLDDVSAAVLMHAAANAAPLDRLVVEDLGSNRSSAGELCALETNAVVRIGGDHWLRVRVGKLRNDRYIPLRPALVELLDTWRNGHDSHELLITNNARPMDRHHVGRIVRRVARAGGLTTSTPTSCATPLRPPDAQYRGLSLDLDWDLDHRHQRLQLHRIVSEDVVV